MASHAKFTLNPFLHVHYATWRTPTNSNATHGYEQKTLYTYEHVIAKRISDLNKPLMYRNFNIYRPPTKLREGNIFSCVCLSVHIGSM